MNELERINSIIDALASEGGCPDGQCRGCKIGALLTQSKAAGIVRRILHDPDIKTGEEALATAMTAGFEIGERLQAAKHLEEVTK